MCLSRLKRINSSAVEVAKKLNMEPLDELRFSMKCARNMTYMVNLTDNVCTCNRFQLKSFRCKHAVVMTMYQGFVARTLCFPYYTVDSWRVACVETIFPFPNKVEWEVFDHILPLQIEPRDFGCPCTYKILSIEQFFRPCRWDKCRATKHTHHFYINQIFLNDN